MSEAEERVAFRWHWRPMTFRPGQAVDEKFWIGVCQWRPYVRGRGLKRVVGPRVYGWVGDPQPAYDLAANLCRRLNEAGADLESPPPWLRKQYTAPRSAAVPKPPRRPGTPLTAAQVRAVRRAVMRDWLLPLGFVEAAGSGYVRRVGEQLHAIQFQASGDGGKFTVNLGIHFTFAPPGAARPLPLADWQAIHCAFGTRLGIVLPGRRDVWFEYGTDRDALRDTLERCAAESVAALDRTGGNWVDPIIALQTVLPLWHGPGPVVRACIYLRRGQWRAATAELAAAAEHLGPTAEVLRVLNGVRDRQAAGADPATDPAARPPEWVRP